MFLEIFFIGPSSSTTFAELTQKENVDKTSALMIINRTSDIPNAHIDYGSSVKFTYHFFHTERVLDRSFKCSNFIYRGFNVKLQVGVSRKVL